MSWLKFTATIEIYQANPYVLVDEQKAQKILPDWKKPMPVLVKINGVPDPPWKINMMPIGDGTFYLYLHGDVREASKTKVGYVVTVEVMFDAEYRNGPQHPMPKWFAEPLNKNQKAKKSWDELTPSRQKEILRYFAGLKSEAAKQRNVEKALSVLSGKTGRFMARTWENGK